MSPLLFLPFIISFSIGFVIYQHLTLLTDHKNKFSLELLLSFGIGLAVSSFLTFSSFIFFNQCRPGYIISINMMTLIISTAYFIYRLKKNKIHWNIAPKISLVDISLMILIVVFLIPALYWSTFFLHGGWDAWSTWNLKARFLFLGEENWKNIFDPILWRSSPHYPLILPLINVWGWCFQSKAVPEIPLITSAVFMLLTLLLLYSSLKYLFSTRWPFLCVIVLLLHSYYMKVALSQYCDIVLSFYLLASLTSLIISKKEDNPTYALLAGLNLGILTFTKPEGLVASGILMALSLFYFLNLKANSFKNKISSWRHVLCGFFIGIIPTLIFQLFYAPQNQTMINGLISSEKPSTWARFDIIWKFCIVEMFGGITPWKKMGMGPWHGIWLVLIIGLVIALFKKGRCFDSVIRIIPLFIAGYMSVIIFYYFVNTYFPIAWWMQVTLHRIYFSLLPIVIFWVFYALWTKKGTQ